MTPDLPDTDVDIRDGSLSAECPFCGTTVCFDERRDCPDCGATATIYAWWTEHDDSPR